ncbi:MAG: tetratricopeptide repeat protein, partial [Ktedonobacterales bacterium]
ARFCARDGVSLSAVTSAGAPFPVAAPPARGVSAGVGGTAELNHQRATDALTAGRYMQAVRQGEAALAKGRATYDVYMLLGQAYAKLGRAGEAASAFALAAKLRPTAEALAAEGAAHRTASQPDAAHLAFTRARQLDPRNAEISYQLGETCLELGRLAEAEGELRDALALRPRHAPTLVALGRLHAIRKEWDEALAVLRQAAECDPPDATAYMELGRALLGRQRPAEAVHALERAVALMPASADVQIALGVGLSAIGRRAAARKALSRALELDPTSAEARRLLKQS